MAPRIIGVGLGRTGTASLKVAIEQLIGGTCHHMFEVGRDEGQFRIWDRALQGDLPDWHELLDPYCGIVDWPGAAFWRELVAAYPDAPVLLSTRDSTETWYRSGEATIFQAGPSDPNSEHGQFHSRMFTSFCSEWPDPQAIKDAYEAHNAEVRATVDPDRLFEYQPGDGWAPLCQALGVGAPDEPFPHKNSTADFLAMRERFEAKQRANEGAAESGD